METHFEGENSHMILSDEDRVALISGDINSSKPLTDEQLNQMALEVRRRKAAAESDSVDSAEFLARGVEGATLSTEVVEKGVKLAEASDSLERSLWSAGKIGVLIANGIGVLKTPWQCIKEERWPTRDEWIRLGFCAVGVALTAAVMVVPGLAVGVAIAVAAVGLVKTVYNNYKKYQEIFDLEQLAQFGRSEMKRLSSEIETLQKKIEEDPSSQEHLDEFKKKQKERTAVADQYVLDGYQIHQLRDELSHPVRAIPNAILAASSVIAMTGAILTVFFPPVGLTLMLVAGVAGLLTAGVSAAAKWYSKRQNEAFQVLSDQSSASEEQSPPSDTDDTDSTVREFEWLRANPRSSFVAGPANKEEVVVTVPSPISTPEPPARAVPVAPLGNPEGDEGDEKAKKGEEDDDEGESERGDGNRPH